MNLRRIFFLYVIGLPLLHALSPLPAITFDLCLSAVCFIGAIFFANRFSSYVQFRRTDLAFAFVYILGLLPLVFSPTSAGSQNLKYAGLIFFVWLLNYWWVREWISFGRISMDQISRFSLISCVALAVSTYVEILTSNLLGLYLSDFLPFSIDTFPQATILGSSFQRPRVFSSEAGFTAIAFEALLPLAILNLIQNRLKLVAFLLSVLPGYVALGSATSFLGFAFVLWSYVFLVRRASVGAWIIFSIAIMLVAFLALSEMGQWLYYEIIGRKIEDLFDSSKYGTVDTFGRREAYSLGAHILSNNFLGIGWGTISQANMDSASIYGQYVSSSGLISLFLEIAVAAGVFGFLITLYLFGSRLMALARRNSLESHTVFFSLFWVMIHHFFVFEFWFPMIWFSLAIADYVLGHVRVPMPPSRVASRQLNLASYPPFTQTRSPLH